MKKLDLDVYNRWLHPNLKWRQFAWDRGLIIIPVSQGGDDVYIYKFKDEKFMREGTGVYNQTDANDQKRLYADIDRAYERYYNKYKNK